tara:strand:- start:574 stop:834 length:261 start_codon:yes stop_codon:yes gene_type:complete
MDMQPIQKSEYKYNKNGSFELFIETQLDSVNSNTELVLIVMWNHINATKKIPIIGMLNFQPTIRSNINVQKTNINTETTIKEYWFI